MNKKVLIVEDQFVEAHDLQIMLEKAGYEVCGIARSVPIAQEMIKKQNPSLVLLDIYLKGKLTGVDLARQLRQDNIAFIYLSANSNEEILSEAKTTEPFGFIVKPFREKDLLTTLAIAHYRHEHSIESNLRRENILKEKLSALIGSNDSWENKLQNIVRTFQLYIPFDYMAAGFSSPDDITGQDLGFLRIGYDEYQQIGIAELLNITGINRNQIIELTNIRSVDVAPAFYNGIEFEQLCARSSLDKLFADTFQMKSRTSLPLNLSKSEHLNFSFYSRKADTYNQDHIGLLNRLWSSMGVNIQSPLPANKRETVINQHTDDDMDDPAKGSANQEFEGIIGRSHLLLNVFDLITRVARSDTSVLILGESGTGKERIADSIHNLSQRANHPFVKVNCAALPSSLIETELFGHEKGSFTGAMDKRIGKFEKADKGTIFLDEIGEMPLDLQVKLLRVLQEKYIERIGSRDPTPVDVRIVAATNRNLEKEVAEGRFRLDLYYRLNVFPIELPPLRERTEDIPALATHFINYYSRKSGRKITGLSNRVLKTMMAYHWPGNIRELENLIARNVLLAKGTTIEEMIVPGNQKKGIQEADDTHVKTIHENERNHIIAVLKKCNGRVWGPGGAAEMLNIIPSTLKSKMKKLGIRKDYIE